MKEAIFIYAKDWKEWLAQQEDISLNVYKSDPARLISDFYRENQISGDYKGREILELLQNANDAAAENKENGKVLIQLSSDGVIIANTGKYFSAGGINSLRVSDVSPKRRQKQKLIGQKGLGFRSVLNWSHAPIILSGALQLIFHEKKKKEILQTLKDKPNVLEYLTDNFDDLSIDKLPILPFPTLLEEDNGTTMFMNQCINIRKEYDTVIGLPFLKKETYEIVEEELNSIEPEAIIFAKNLNEIKIRSLKDEKNWVAIRHKNKITIENKITEEVISEWNIHFLKEKIPDDIQNNLENKEFEIIIALPVDNNSFEPSYLYSYFPTDLFFPFKVLIHATLDLEASRNRPQSVQSNRYIFKKIAKFLCDIAENLNIEDDPWIRVKLLQKTKDLEGIFEKFSFNEEMIQYAKTKKIIPALCGSYAKPTDIKLIMTDDLRWLPKNSFPDIAQPLKPISLAKLLKKLGIESLSEKELKSRIENIKIDSIKDRAKLIFEIISRKLFQESLPELLIDNSGEIITNRKRIFFLPDTEDQYILPEWLEIKFLNSELRKHLTECFNVSERRDLRNKLTEYHVQEYALLNIISAITAEAKKKISEDEQNSEKYIKDMLECFYSFYVSLKEPPHISSDIRIPMLNSLNEIKTTNELYFSENYPGAGPLLAKLYEREPNKLIYDLSKIGFLIKEEKFYTFLKWIGIAEYPREMRVNEVENAYLKFVINSLSYPVKLDDREYKTADEFNYYKIESAVSVDGINEILKGDYLAILTWLAKDSRFLQWRYPDIYHGTLNEKPYLAQYFRRYSGKIPSYIKWKIQSTAWLKSKNNTVKPEECLLDQKGLEKLFPMPLMKASELTKRYGLEKNDFIKAFENAGVSRSINDLNIEALYKGLIKVPEIDSSGTIARSLYRIILEKYDNIDKESEAKKEFFKTGYMYGKGEMGKKYYPLSELKHADSYDFQNILVSKFNIVDLPKKVGAIQVKNIFNIDSLEKKKLNTELIRFVETDYSLDLNNIFQKVKPYIYALRKIKNKSKSELLAFKNVKISICNNIEIKMEYDGIILNSQLEEPYQWIMKENTAYILYESVKHPSLDSDLLTECLGEVIANIFNITSGTEFARLLRCSEGDRIELLKRISGEKEIEDIEELKKEFHNVEEFADIEIVPPSDEKKEKKIQILETEKSDIKNNFEEKIQTGKIEVTPIKHVSKHNGRKKIVILKKSKKGGVAGTVYKRVDGDLCEERIIAFEFSENRFPYLVSNIHGYKGPRCDILSFDEEIRYKKFKGEDKFDISLVDRFIEVKGRANENTPISLAGNELRAAELYGEKYFLYRLYQKNINEYVLMIMQHPLKHLDAIETVKDIYFNRAKNVEKMEITFGEEQKIEDGEIKNV
jgi:hypothetical protein